jgi:23S rRNA (cytidine1920-2'-O)/16S rRNA (cytidine1409-2'-O)-methyltransferase
VLELAVPGWEALVLVKPQFEASRSEVAKGVVRDPEVHRKVLESVIEAALQWDAVTAGVVDSGLPGPKGNREFFVHLQHRPGEPNPDDSDRLVADAVG